GSSDLSQFKDPEKFEKLIRLFLARTQAQSGPTASNATALSLLGQGERKGGISAALLSRYV
ncbi:MAG: hypothetical protein ORN49_00450, partial [Rhodobacteraceae bacterium]|nr:hypothetical protein [Paracoccaceae bacterium]